MAGAASTRGTEVKDLRDTILRWPFPSTRHRNKSSYVYNISKLQNILIQLPFFNIIYSLARNLNSKNL